MYEDGRKTVLSFGNKRFSIEKSVRVDNHGNIIQNHKRFFCLIRKKIKT